MNAPATLRSSMLLAVAGLLAVPPGMALDVGVASWNAPVSTAARGADQASSSGDLTVNPKEIRITDPAEDVRIQPGGPSHPVSGFTTALDITEARLFGETGESIRVQVRMKNLLEGAQGLNPTNPENGKSEVFVCFKLGDRPYGLFGTFNAGTLTRGILDNYNIGLVKDACNKGEAGKKIGAEFVRMTQVGLRYAMDLEASTIEFLILRSTFGVLTESEPPGKAEVISNLWVITFDIAGESELATSGVRRAQRWDAAPDEAPAEGSLQLIFPTANRDLRVAPESPFIVRLRSCLGAVPLPTYEIEAGGMRGVPMTIFNHQGQDRVVTLTAARESGQEWETRIMPKITIPAGTQDRPGNLTVNVIADSPPSTKHKECTTIRVRAVDAERADIVGESAINVLAVSSPRPDRSLFYLHSAPGNKFWINVDKQDKDDKSQPIEFPGATSGGALDAASLSLFETLITIPSDTKASHDLVVNTTSSGKNAKVNLNLVSNNAPTRAKVTASLVTTGPKAEILGTTMQILTIETAAKTFGFDVPIQFVRDQFAEGDPSRVVSAANRVTLVVQYEPLSQDDNLQAVKPAGRVFLLPGGSTIQLPIWATIKRNVNEPGALGAFITLRGLSATEAFANPGFMRVFNFTVQNEGATTDVAVVSATVTGGKVGNWTTQIQPPGPFELAPGASQDFSLGIMPSPEVPESASVLLDVTATSQSDPTSRGTTAIKITATLGQALPQEHLGSLVVADKKKGLLPGLPGLVPALVLVGGALWASRRRHA